VVRSNGFKIQIPPTRTCPHYNVLLKVVHVYGSLYNLYQYLSNLQLNVIELHEKNKSMNDT